MPGGDSSLIEHFMKSEYRPRIRIETDRRRQNERSGERTHNGKARHRKYAKTKEPIMGAIVARTN